MNKFKQIMYKNHCQEKSMLRKLYVDKQIHIETVRSSEQPVEEEAIYRYRELSFRFMGTGFRTPEQLTLLVSVPVSALRPDEVSMEHITAYEDFLLRTISPKVNALSTEYENDRKSAREKPHFSMQTAGCVILKRNGCCYIEEREEFCLRIHFSIPLINGTNINGKSGFKAARAVLDIISTAIAGMDSETLSAHILLYKRQEEIRHRISALGLVAFVADGSILPRYGSSEQPLKNAVPFSSPESMSVTLSLSDGYEITGMGIQKGITVITGGGYSGKSTLLDSLEAGIYNHVPGDGREYVITDETAFKIYAEDGRIVHSTDISPFFSHIPHGNDVTCFSTPNASGSVSQGTNIIEAVYAGCGLLLIDEDTSATNFMIRDEKMRELVIHETIIPFTDRVRELKEMGISTVLVIGGSGEYLPLADCVLLAEDYKIHDKTLFCRKHYEQNAEKRGLPYPYRLCKERFLKSEFGKNNFFYADCVEIENARYIKIDDRIADISKLTAISEPGQITSLIRIIEILLAEENNEVQDLMKRCSDCVERLFTDSLNTILSNSHKYELWLEQVRPMDVFFTLCRMRGIEIFS